MKGGIKASISRGLSSNGSLNKTAMQIRKSWDEVSTLLNSVNKPKKK